MPPQQLAFSYAKPLARIALFMEMRLGKTLVAIRWAELKEAKRILVVCPSPVIVPWKEELTAEGYQPLQIMHINGNEYIRRLQAANLVAKWFLIGYESLLSSWELLEYPWDCIILDESTRIKNPQTQVTKLLVRGCQFVRYKAILSGLPNPESEMDFFSQFHFLHGGFMHYDNFWWWRKHYALQHFHGGWEVKHCFKPKIREEVRQLGFFMTRKQAGIGSKKIYEKRYVEMNPKQRTVYEQVKKDFEYEYETRKNDTKWVPVKLTWMCEIASGFTPDGDFIGREKLHEMLRLLRGDLKGETVVVWFRHTHELEMVGNEMESLGYRVSYFYGSRREDGRFKTGDSQILCAQAKCGMMGLDWSVASTAIYYSNWYDGEIRAQSEDRIIHPKKKEPVLYIDLVTQDSIDEDVVDILRKKKKQSDYYQRKSWLKSSTIS